MQLTEQLVVLIVQHVLGCKHFAFRECAELSKYKNKLIKYIEIH